MKAHDFSAEKSPVLFIFYQKPEVNIMACFLVPAAEALVTTVAGKVMEKKEGSHNAEGHEVKIPFTRKIGWLNNMLWGGSALLAFEHVWHGEVVPWFPFLTAMYDPADKAEMLHEMATVGTSMAVLITAVWGVMCLAADSLVKRAMKEKTAE